MKVQDPCRADRDLPDTGGIGGFFQDRALETLDEAACEAGSSREELLLAIADEDLADDYERKYGEDPRSIGFLGPAVGDDHLRLTMNENPQTRMELVQALRPPHAAALGIEIAEIEVDRCVMSMPFKPELVTVGDVVHGGAISALVDMAVTVAAWATDEVPESAAGLDGLADGQLRARRARRRPGSARGAC